jgi:hypothetical protein
MNANFPEPDDDAIGHSQSESAAALISQLLLLLCTGYCMLQLFPMLPLSTRLMLLALVLLSLRLWGGLMLLVAGLLDLLIREFPRAGRFETADAVTWTLLLSAVVMFGFRQRRDLQQLSSRSIRSIFRDVFGAAVESVSGSEGDFDESPEAAPAGLADRLLGSGVQAIRGLLLLLACTLTAALLLEWLPRGATLSRAVREFAAEDPELSGVALLATIVAGALLLAGELSWRLLTPAQARMYLRSLRLQFFFPDLSMLSRGRQRERLRRVRERVEAEG